MPKQYPVYLREVSKHLAAVPANVPAHRRAARHVYTFSSASFEEQLLIWDHIWNNTRGFWLRVHATFFLERHLKKEEHLAAMWPVIVRWQYSVDDWGLCDSLAKKVSDAERVHLKALRKQ
jgi:hypothetical protein